MLPSQAFHRPDRASAGAVCLAEGLAPRSRARRGDRGAVIVHVAVAMTGVLALSALTIDLGTLWVSRGQAQNAVDAAAHAGAVSLARDPSNLAEAEAAARAVAQQHTIWGQPVGTGELTVTSGSCPAGAPAITGECMNIAFEKGAGGGTPLPVFFARVFGAAPATLRASASAKVMNGNTSSCVRPIAIMDSWQPGSGTWTFNEQFAPPDVYLAPSPSDSGTGHTSASLNFSLPLGRGEVRWPVPPQGNHYFNLDIARVGSPAFGGDYNQRYLDNWASCNGEPVRIGDSVGYWDAGHEETTMAAQSLISSDPGAYWDGTAIRGSAFRVSPRLLTIALVDPQYYLSQQTVPLPNRRYVVRNLVGFFLEQADGSAPGLDYPLLGVFVRAPGSFSSTADNVAPESAFLKTVALVR